MPTNQFLPVATGGGANVITQSAYAALTSFLANGWSSGVVDSATFNKSWRQTTFIASVLGQIINDYAGVDANDDGVIANFENNFMRALRKFDNSGTYGVDTGSAANIYQFAYLPSVPSVTDGQVFRIRVLHTNTGGSTFTPNAGTVAAAPIWSTAHAALNGGEMFATGDAWLQWNSVLNGTGVWLLIHSTGGNLRAGRLLNIQLITTNGTYTPTPGMGSAYVRIVGGGAGGGGCAAGGASTTAAAGGGASGSYAEGVFSAATIGASQSITIGTAGTGGASGNNNGNNGGTTSFGALMSAPGGVGGSGSAAQTPPFMSAGGPCGTTATGGTLVSAGGNGGNNGFSFSATSVFSGAGGGSPLFGNAGGGKQINPNAGQDGTAYGAGGSGGCTGNSGVARAGGNGIAGAVLVFEYSV